MEIQIISLLIAILAVIVGPIVTYRIAKKNLEFQFRTMTQEKWIDKLEEAASSFLLNTNNWIEIYPSYHGRIRENPALTNEINKEIDMMLNSINNSFIRLDLLLDAAKTDQKVILDKIIFMKTIVNQKSFDVDSVNKLRNSHNVICANIKIVTQSERKKIVQIFR